MVGELEIVDGDVDYAFAFRAPALVGDLTMRRRAKPVVDLALHLADAGVLGARTRLLEGVLDLLGRRVRVPPRHLRPQPPGTLPTGDPLEQRTRRLGTRPVSDQNAHAP